MHPLMNRSSWGIPMRNRILLRHPYEEWIFYLPIASYKFSFLHTSDIVGRRSQQGIFNGPFETSLSWIDPSEAPTKIKGTMTSVTFGLFLLSTVWLKYNGPFESADYVSYRCPRDSGQRLHYLQNPIWRWLCSTMAVCLQRSASTQTRIAGLIDIRSYIRSVRSLTFNMCSIQVDPELYFQSQKRTKEGIRWRPGRRMQGFLGTLLRLAFPKGLLDQLGCGEADLGLHVWERRHAGGIPEKARIFRSEICWRWFMWTDDHRQWPKG